MHAAHICDDLVCLASCSCASHRRSQALANVHGIPWGEASRFSSPGSVGRKAEVRLGTPAWECDLSGLICCALARVPVVLLLGFLVRFYHTYY